MGLAGGLAGAGLAGVGAGWADAADESASDAAITINNLKNESGIQVTGAGTRVPSSSK
jgi:hypothetical protein